MRDEGVGMGVPGGACRLGPAARLRWPAPVPVSGVLDRGDLELQEDLVADQDAAGLQRGVPGDAVVLAVDAHRALEPGAQVAERVGREALELERDGNRLTDALDGQVAGELEAGGPGRGHAGRDEGD